MRVLPASICLYFFLLILGLSGFFFAVLWPQTVGLYAFITFAAAGGFGVALYIYSTKRRHQQLVCPLGSDCNAVVTSRYSKFLGVPLEHWGMGYYAVIVFSYLLLVFVPRLLPGVAVSGLLLLTTAAFLFSLYLLFVQAFLLRQWCIWCLLSAMLSIIIFLASLTHVDVAVAFLAEVSTVLSAVQAMGFILGMGGATTALFLFSRFLRDFDIDEGERQTLKGISELVWLGLALVLVGQFASFVSSVEAFARSGPFVVQTIALFVVVVSGAVLMVIFAPLLAVIPFQETVKSRRSPLASLRTPLFLTGAIALSSWYFSFGMNYAPPYGLAVLLSAYAATLAASIAAALAWERVVRGSAR